jgi:soluble lytic murein transglycosylase-like protein
MRYLLFAAVVVVLGIPVSSGQALARTHANAHSYRVAENSFGQDRFAHRDFGQSGAAQYDALGGMAAQAASAAGVPASLVERVIRRESGGNPRAVSRGNYGLMQIRLGTARAMGYSGSAAGLLDPQTNMTYAVRYLAGAYRAAGGNENRAVALYARGYYDVAKTQGVSPYAAAASSGVPGGPQQFAYQKEAYDGEAPVYRTRHRHRRA